MPRRLLVRLVGAWLVWQSAAMLAPFPVWAASRPVDLQECDCPHGPGAPHRDGAMCPMHETREGRTECVLRSASSDNAWTLVSLLGSVGLPASHSTVYVSAAGRPIHFTSRFAIDHPLVPESPPPRA